MKSFLIGALLIPIFSADCAQADEVTYQTFSLSFENKTSLPFTFEYDSANSHCWRKDGFDTVVVTTNSTKTGIETEAEIGESLTGVCATESPRLAMTVIGNANTDSSFQSAPCKFDYVGTPEIKLSQTDSCTLKDSSGTKYTVSVSGEASNTTFTVKKE